MKLKSRIISLSLSVAASIFLVIVGCGGGGGGSDIPFAVLPTDANLSLTKTVNNPKPDVGEGIVFTVTVSNVGPANATGVVVTDQLPSGFTYVTDNSGGAYNPATGVWPAGNVATGGSRVLNITATVNGSGNYTNLAEVTADNDSTPDNNTAGVAAPPPSINVSVNQIQTDCTTNEVRAFVTVVDQLGDPVTTLTKNDFTVTENQIMLQANEFEVQFVNAIPLSVSVVLDYSTSIFDSGVNTVMEDSAIAFIDQLSDIDTAEIIKFGTTVQVIQGFTSDKALLRAAVKAPFTPEPETEIYQAILKGTEDAAMQPGENRKAVVIFTDGKQNPDPSPFGVTIDDAIDTANDNSIPIFPIGLGIGIDVPSLTRLADETGGIFYQSIGPSDVGEIYQQLADALIINQFVFTYTSALTGSLPSSLTIEAEYIGYTDSDTKAFTSCP